MDLLKDQIAVLTLKVDSMHQAKSKTPLQADGV